MKSNHLTPHRTGFFITKTQRKIMSLQITKHEEYSGAKFKAGDKVYSKLANPSHRKVYTIKSFWHWNMRLENTIEVHFEEHRNKWSMDALEHAPIWMVVDDFWKEYKASGRPCTA